MYKKILLMMSAISISLGMVSCSLVGSLTKNSNYEPGAIINKKNTDDIMDRGPVKGGTLKLFSTVPNTLNPILTGNIFVRDFCELIFESMVVLDRSQKPLPGLAKRWEVSNDGLTWTFYMRENVLWHDGIPFTSEDVEFTFETILNPGINSVYKTNLQNITTFAAIDRNTFRIVLKKPNSFTPEQMVIPIIPKHHFSGEDILKSPRSMNPIGTGPYKFQSYKQNENLKLVSNNNWWNAKNPDKNFPDMPYLAEVEVKIYGSTKEVINSFQAGDVDVASIGVGESGKYRGRTDLILKRYTGNNFEFVAFNLSKPAFADRSVRQAIAYGVDRLKIINDLLPGEAVVSDIPVIPGTWLNDSNTMVYALNKDKAREVLIQNGWRADREIFYKYVNGIYTPLNFELLVNDDNETRCKAADKIAEHLREIGFKVQVKKVKWEDELRYLNTKRYDMALLGCNVSSPADIANLYATPVAAVESNGVPTSNVSGYSNPQVDSYLKDMLKEFDSGRRKSIFTNLKDTVNNDVPYLGLYFYNKSILYNKKLRGDISPHLWNKFSDVTKWYIPVK